MLNLKKMN